MYIDKKKALEFNNKIVAAHEACKKAWSDLDVFLFLFPVDLVGDRVVYLMPSYHQFCVLGPNKPREASKSTITWYRSQTTATREAVCQASQQKVPGHKLGVAFLKAGPQGGGRSEWWWHYGELIDFDQTSIGGRQYARILVPGDGVHEVRLSDVRVARQKYVADLRAAQDEARMHAGRAERLAKEMSWLSQVIKAFDEKNIKRLKRKQAKGR